MRYSYGFIRVPGKLLVAAGVLSRSPLEENDSSELGSRSLDQRSYSDLPATDKKSVEIREARSSDTTYQIPSAYVN